MKENRDPKTRALSNANCYICQCVKLGVSKSELLKMVKTACQTACQTAGRTAGQTACQKENEEGNRENPPYNPSKERREEEKEKVVVVATSRAREENSLPASDPLVESCTSLESPTFKEVSDWAKIHGGDRYNDAILREWYDECQFSGWKDSKGYLIRNWKRHLAIWRNYRDLNKKIADPERIPDARNRNGGNSNIHIDLHRRHADNWRPTPKEDIEHVF